MKIPTLTPKQFCNLLMKHGWKPSPNKGNSHLCFIKEGYSKVPVPVTHQKDISKPLLLKMLKQTELIDVINN